MIPKNEASRLRKLAEKFFNSFYQSKVHPVDLMDDLYEAFQKAYQWGREEGLKEGAESYLRDLRASYKTPKGEE